MGRSWGGTIANHEETEKEKEIGSYKLNGMWTTLWDNLLYHSLRCKGNICKQRKTNPHVGRSRKCWGQVCSSNVAAHGRQ